MIITTIKLNVSFAEHDDFSDDEADEVIEAVDDIDWPQVAREAIAGWLRSTPSTVDPLRVKIDAIDEDLF